ncbi:hypothetical protein HLH36_03505 [Gluconacetobacter aggeris]|uniref:Uncharacterized protein n=1 Tax=Gluconacetobacter aggeris TaxID=1286186 RepID=A0A7W4NVA7_9PROT|nr:hypothetical protein [Gluconacetobacter aggeris]MBB2167429.1 hypothetical protein [Gluconacetobacter aggeris]
MIELFANTQLRALRLTGKPRTDAWFHDRCPMHTADLLRKEIIHTAKRTRADRARIFEIPIL